jgi:hypothetical protein
MQSQRAEKITVLNVSTGDVLLPPHCIHKTTVIIKMRNTHIRNCHIQKTQPPPRRHTAKKKRGK